MTCQERRSIIRTRMALGRTRGRDREKIGVIMKPDGTSGKKSSQRPGNGKILFRYGMIAFALVAIISFAGCGEVKPLTPEEQSLVNAWKIGDSLQKAYARESVDEVMDLLAPALSMRPDTRIQLERLFGLFRKMDLTLVMDSGEVDETTHSVTFRAHWTMTGLPKTGSGPRYFQTGECRMVVLARKSPAHARIESLTGDTFLSAPPKPNPPS